MIIILYLFGEFFSSKLLAASIASSFYLQKVDSTETRAKEEVEYQTENSKLDITSSKKFIEDEKMRNKVDIDEVWKSSYKQIEPWIF